jgi:triosephosphate isomerase
MKPLIVANWKCNPTTLAKAKNLFDSIKKGVQGIKNVKVVLCPPFVFLPVLKSRMRNLKVGAQDCFWEEKGAYTGEVSPKMLKNLGLKYVIIGHSERRKYLREKNEMINKKIKASLSFKLKPIFCIGETKKEKNRGQSLKVINSQISRGLRGITEKEARRVIIAYEPAWAIGTGKPCDTNIVLTQSLIIRGVIKKMFGPDTSRRIPILYGGSVDSQNAPGFISAAKMSGLLVGGASLEAKEFTKIVKAVNRA